VITGIGVESQRARRRTDRKSNAPSSSTNDEISFFLFPEGRMLAYPSDFPRATRLHGGCQQISRRQLGRYHPAVRLT
jgi:hypothetical protein